MSPQLPLEYFETLTPREDLLQIFFQVEKTNICIDGFPPNTETTTLFTIKEFEIKNDEIPNTRNSQQRPRPRSSPRNPTACPSGRSSRRVGADFCPVPQPEAATKRSREPAAEPWEAPLRPES